MKKTFIFGLIAAALGFTACSSEDDLNVNDNNQKKGLVLRATVEQPAESRATFTDNEGTWQFAFATDDKVRVTNDDKMPDFYTFTNEGTEFKCEDAKAAEGPVAWFAYFPSNEVSLVGQSGTKEDVANKYALAGKSSATTGEEGLNITMSPKVAILVINNQKGTIDINVKNSATTWVSGLTANEDGFDVTTSTTKQTLLSATSTGTYYIAVPAGIQLAVKDGDKVIKSTDGLTAGKYYNLTIFPFGQGEAAATGIGNVKWVQLWEGGPKFAEYNIGATSAIDYGGYYAWGGSQDKVDDHYTGKTNLTSDYDTATKLWGSNWRMPTKTELQGLLDNCTCTWKENYNGTGVNGLLCTGTEGTNYEINSIFLPAAGYYPLSQFSDGSCVDETFAVYYWSSNIFTGTKADAFTLNYDCDDNKSVTKYKINSQGHSVRAVLNEVEE